MTYTTIILEEFFVVGLSVRTTNQNGQSQKDLGELWEKFLGGNIAVQIADKASSDIYCVYTDYERDGNGPYTTILGYKVQTLKNLSQTLSSKTIPASKYYCYKSEEELPGAVIATWMNIWKSAIPRRYLADFDVYETSPGHTESAKVSTYVSVQ